MFVLYAGKRNEVAHAGSHKGVYDTLDDAERASISDYRNEEAIVVVEVDEMPQEFQSFDRWYARVGNKLVVRP
jgi:hypothetical protein